MWIRQVLVPGFTTDLDDLKNTREFIKTLNNVDKIEVLPYHTLGVVKYQNLGIDYPLKDIQAPSKEIIEVANKILKGDFDE
jgi:pyruvate formate lyase activating enzyme